MLLVLTMLAVAAAAPYDTYDERQDGEFNVRADVQNVVFVVAIPQKMQIPSSILAGLLKSKQNQESHFQERSDSNVLEAFVEPSTPYKVEIGSSERYSDGDGRAVEVVIAGRRRADLESQDDGQEDRDDYKLLGATEQCGPDRVRDPVSLTCVDAAPVDKKPVPEVVPAPSPA